jgi:hypothetical protein
MTTTDQHEAQRSGPFWHTAAPLRPGRVAGRGGVVHRDGISPNLEAALIDSDGHEIATATASARVIPLAEARSAV